MLVALFFMEVLLEINSKDYKGEEINKIRRATRAVLIDENDKIALLNVSKLGIYKLPGGGIDEGEEIEESLKRECYEETGCEIKDIKEIGVVVENRNSLKQINYCFICNVKSKGKPEFTQKELDLGFKVEWVSINEAVDKIRSGNKKISGASNSILRESFIVEKAIEN